jgi:hypothetical protein
VAFDVQGSRSSNRHQLELIRRYSRILREQAATYRTPHIGARERRLAREAAENAALNVSRPAKPVG